MNSVIICIFKNYFKKVNGNPNLGDISNWTQSAWLFLVKSKHHWWEWSSSFFLILKGKKKTIAKFHLITSLAYLFFNCNFNSLIVDRWDEEGRGIYLKKPQQSMKYFKLHKFYNKSKFWWNNFSKKSLMFIVLCKVTNSNPLIRKFLFYTRTQKGISFETSN